MNRLLSYWIVDASSLLVVLVIALWYWQNRRVVSWKKVSFLLASLVLLVISVCSPLAVLSHEYLFSAHMAVHVMLLLLVGPLLVLACGNTSGRLFRFVGEYPLAGWLTGVGIMWFWHIPAVFNAMMEHSMHHGHMGAPQWWLSVLENASLIAAGIVFSLPLINPVAPKRLQPLTGVIYLFTACIGCSVLGLLITFAPAGLYHHYLSMHDPYALNNTIMHNWNLSRETDQQIAGLIMWVPCCFLYVLDAMYLLIHWLNEKETTYKPTT